MAQVNTVTPGGTIGTETFTITVGSTENPKTVTYTAESGDTATIVAAGLATAFAASTEPEVLEISASAASGVLTLTARTAGVPFTQTSSASGSATLVTSTATAARGPYHWSAAANWSGGSVPTNSDDVVFENSDIPVRYDIDQNSITLTSLTIDASYTGTIGLPERNDNGYAEYRDTYLKIGATAATIGRGVGAGSPLIKINFGSVQTTTTVHATGFASEGQYACWLKGTHSSNVFNLLGGSVALAPLGGETATAATVRAAGNVDSFISSGVTLTTLTQTGGFVLLGCAATTINKPAGELTTVGSGAVTTLYNDGGLFTCMSTGTITTLHTSDGATTDFSRDSRTKTVTTSTLNAGATYLDPFRAVTHTNPIVLNRCGVGDVSVDFGTHVTLVVAAGA